MPRVVLRESRSGLRLTTRRLRGFGRVYEVRDTVGAWRTIAEDEDRERAERLYEWMLADLRTHERARSCHVKQRRLTAPAKAC